MRAVRTVGAFLCFVVLTSLASAQILTFNFTGTSPGQNAPWMTTSVLDDHLLLSTGWSLGSGVNGATGNNRFNASNWSTGASFSNASAGNDYVFFSIAPVNGYQLDLRNASISFSLQNSPSGPDFYSVRSSADLYATDLSAASAALVSSGATTTSSFTIPNSVTWSALIDPVEFRLYGWGATATAGTLSVNAWSMTGSVSAVPEPATSATIGGLVALSVAWWYRRRHAARAASDRSAPLICSAR